MADAPDWVTLTDGEEVIWAARPSMVPYLTTLIGEFVLIGLGVGLWIGGGFSSLLGVSFDPTIGLLPIPLWSALALVLIGWGLLGIASTALDWWSRYYLITTEEIYKKQGLFSRTVENTRLDQVQNTAFTQSWLGRLASYGDVQIDTAGTGGKEIVFKKVANPDGIIEKVTRQLDRSRPGRGRV